MYVKSIKVTDYSTGKEYKYGDNSGSWQSIVAVDGKVNGNQGKAGTLTVTASATSANGVSPSVPAGGLAKGSSTTTQAASVPDGWVMTPSGKVVPASSTTVSTFKISSSLALPGLALQSAFCRGSASLSLQILLTDSLYRASQSLHSRCSRHLHPRLPMRRQPLVVLKLLPLMTIGDS